MGKIIVTSIWNGVGYKPVSMHQGWQMAYLTSCDKHNFDDLERMEVHRQTDELFILLKGKACLVEADYEGGEPVFDGVCMETFVLYNVPQGVWHNIAMAPDTLLLIVEKDGTHLGDVAYNYFREEDSRKMNELISSLI